MRGLLLKDLYCVKEYLKQLGFVMICMILMTIFLKNTSLIGFYLVFISLSVLSTTIVADEK